MEKGNTTFSKEEKSLNVAFFMFYFHLMLPHERLPHVGVVLRGNLNVSLRENEGDFGSSAGGNHLDQSVLWHRRRDQTAHVSKRNHM